MQDKQTDWHIGMITALVFVAASAIFQTSTGLRSDNLSALRSQQMFAAVVASSATSPNPHLAPYVNQLRRVDIDNAGRAQITGVVVGINAHGLVVRSWGGDWLVILSNATTLQNSGGKTTAVTMRPGDVIFVDGLIAQQIPNLVSARKVFDYTVFRAPTASVQLQYMGSGMVPVGTSQGTQSATNTVIGMQPKPEVVTPTMKQSLSDDVGVVSPNTATGPTVLHAPLQKSMVQY